jgi:hypothetical protein
VVQATQRSRQGGDCFRSQGQCLSPGQGPCPQESPRELNDPANVGHPALFRVSRLPIPNNEESHEHPNQ